MFNNKLKHNNNIQQCSKSKTLYIKSSYKASSISTIATSLELNENYPKVMVKSIATSLDILQINTRKILIKIK